MALSLFKTKEATDPRPARAALRAHLDIDQGIVKQMAELNARLFRITTRERDLNDLLAKKQALQDSVDDALANARYNEQPEPNLSTERRQLTELDNQVRSLADAARVDGRTKTKLQTDLPVLQQKRAELKSTTDRLLWEAALEEMSTYAEEYRQAEAAFRAVHRRVFAAALAADTIAMSRQYGQFVSSALYHDQLLTKPIHAAFYPDQRTPEEVLTERQEDSRSLGKDADKVIHDLLNGA
jgi:hypothetical protein